MATRLKKNNSFVERGTVFRFYLNKRHSFMGLVGSFVVVLWDFFLFVWLRG